MTNRLFITLDVPNDTINKIVSLRDEFYTDKHPKWEGKDKLHITLKFLGDTNIDLIPHLENMLDRLIDKYEKIELSFNRFGMFYRNRDPKIFWIGADKNSYLEDLQDGVDEYSELLNFEREKRKFHPHLTLLRIKGHENIKLLEQIKETKIEPISFTANKISLMKSELKPGGSIYSKIKSFELR